VLQDQAASSFEEAWAASSHHHYHLVVPWEVVEMNQVVEIAAAAADYVVVKAEHQYFEDWG
jgi:hypothetical protein